MDDLNNRAIKLRLSLAKIVTKLLQKVVIFTLSFWHFTNLDFWQKKEAVSQKTASNQKNQTKFYPSIQIPSQNPGIGFVLLQYSREQISRSRIVIVIGTDINIFSQFGY